LEEQYKNNLYIETYGCQMNLSDSEIIRGLMLDNGYQIVENIDSANIVLINTCSVREHAEDRVLQRIQNLRKTKQEKNLILGLIGCMAERLQDKLFDIDKSIDVILGPDNYRKLPEYIKQIETKRKICDTELSKEETYSDIIPLRESPISAWIPIMRGCDNFCSYCIVPYTRGTERSRGFSNIIDEAKKLINEGYKELYLLGQNVNSYKDENKDFSDLLKSAAEIDSRVRVRFMTSHPKDLSDKLILTISSHSNICNYIHLPFQAGSDRILEMMNRKYTRQNYIDLIGRIRRAVPDVSISTDIIVGYPTETEEDFQDTLNLLKEIKFDSAFMFKYSPREGTPAYKLVDDVPEKVKGNRLARIIEAQQEISASENQKLIGTTQSVLIEALSKKSEKEFQGRLDNNKVAVFPGNGFAIGNIVNIKILKTTSATLIGEIA
jgi:tRNA-2-methylthio-N6-dimethylallyladenosine synthase